jgi:hypothetical protein
VSRNKALTISFLRRLQNNPHLTTREKILKSMGCKRIWTPPIWDRVEAKKGNGRKRGKRRGRGRERRESRGGGRGSRLTGTGEREDAV